jgi:putative transposase
MSRRPAQLALDLRASTRGGRRPGAGRKPRIPGRPIVHPRRPELTRHQPVHVSLRVGREVGRLRRRAGYAAVRGALMVCVGRPDFRIVEASIQGNHLHLVIEADDKDALARGVRAFMISVARRLNRAVGRTGPVFERYHLTVVRTPRQARHALAYVVNNWRRHGEHLAGFRRRTMRVDPYSSGPRFAGWRDRLDPVSLGLPPGYDPLPVQAARSWLLTTGWRRHHPLIDPREVPGPPPRR